MHKERELTQKLAQAISDRICQSFAVPRIPVLFKRLGLSCGVYHPGKLIVLEKNKKLKRNPSLRTLLHELAHHLHWARMSIDGQLNFCGAKSARRRNYHDGFFRNYQRKAERYYIANLAGELSLHLEGES